MKNSPAIMKLIQARHSVRTYQDREIPDDILDAISEYIKEVLKPYDGKVRIQIIKKADYGKEDKLGTYGVIKGAKYFLGAVCGKGEYDLVTLGYVLEKIVLYCTSLGLGTVWMGGTFQKGGFAKAVNLQEDEIFAIVVPFGYEAKKKSLVETILGDHHLKREEFSKLFFDETMYCPLTRGNAGIYEEALRMIQAAPSALNKQPWRVIKKGEKLHFYMINAKGLHRVDLGIALAHFHLTVLEQGIKGEFVREDPKIECDFEYLVTWC